VAGFKVLSRCSPEGSEETHENMLKSMALWVVRLCSSVEFLPTFRWNISPSSLESNS
jgi:hypothetical protein